jgi:DnaK suppressor protein
MMAAKKQAAKSAHSATKTGKAKKPAAKATPAAAAKPAARKSAAPKKPATKVASPPVKPVTSTKAPMPVSKTAKPAGAFPAEPVRKPVAAPAPVASRPVPPPRAADGEDGEIGESLLAGPRNVKPYVAKRGEQYMSKEQLEHFRTILTNWKQDLMMEVDRTVSHMKDEAANFPDPNDRATQEEEFSLELRTRDRERKLIRKIDEALGRIEDGSYGYCLETGEQIGVKRLEARPVATLSLEAQERRERREKQYGDRDDRYR